MMNWMTLEEAAQCLKMGKSMLYDLGRTGKVAAPEMRREWRSDAEELDRWIKKCEDRGIRRPAGFRSQVDGP
jgi:excisionase family DNA binding protein